MKFDFDTPMTFYELLAIILAAIAIMVPIVQVIWKKWIQKAQLNYISNGKVRLLFNQSGSYLQIDGVYEAINKPISVKKVSIQVNRERNNDKLNLSWSTFRSPVYQNIAGNSLQTTETAHPFRIEADSIMCAFIEFADNFDSFWKTFNQETKVLFESISQIRKYYREYSDALNKYKSSEEYKRVKSIIEKDFFWNIGQYKIELTTFYKKKSAKYYFTFSVNESDYKKLISNIDESLISPLKDSFQIMRNYQWADVELKESN